MSVIPTTLSPNGHGVEPEVLPHGTDERIRTDAEAILQQSSYPVLRRLRCDCRGRVLTVQGTVPSFYLKQIVQHLLQRIEDVDRIFNLLAVENGSTGSHSVEHADRPLS